MPSDRQATRTTEPGSTPISLAEAKTYMHVDLTDTPNDAIITLMIEAAISRIESWLGRALITQTWTYISSFPGGDVDENLLHPEFPLELAGSVGRGSRIYLPYPPLIDITEISTFAVDNTETTFSSDNYLKVTKSTPGYVALNQGASWPTGLRPAAGFQIVYTAGFGAAAAVPADIKLAIYTLTVEAYDVRGLSRGGGPAASAVAAAVVQLPQLLARWRVSRMGGVL